MSCTQAFLARFLPRRARRQVPSGDEPHLGSSQFVVRAFRPVDAATSEYQSRLQHLRSQEQSHTCISPNLGDMTGDAHRHKRAKVEDLEPKKELCRICYSEIEGDYLTPCLICRKPYCSDCIKKQFEMALKDKEDMPPRCCRRVLYHNVVKDILPAAELEIYKQRYDESITPNPFYCPKPTCSAFIPPRHLKPVRGKITCNQCNTISCYKCKRVVNSGEHSCVKSTETDDLIKQFGYKRCPKCNTAAMKMYGCPHVRCNNCGAHFCWDCLRPINICSVKPCARARDDGDDSEPDDGDSPSEDDGEDSVRHAVSMAESMGASAPAALSDPTLPQQIARDIPERAAASETELVRRPREDTSIPTNIAPDTVNPTRVALFETPEVDQAASATPREIANLDDPNRQDVEWENSDEFDFGEEPTDENWDIWGCLHRFDVVSISTIPDKWLANLDKNKPLGIECMGCFRTMQMTPAPEDAKDKGEEDVPLIPGLPEDDIVAGGADQNADAKPKTKKDKKRAVYDCAECGVIFCFWCRRMALRRVEKYRQDAGLDNGVTQI